jgi:hypothetical protein
MGFRTALYSFFHRDTKVLPSNNTNNSCRTDLGCFNEKVTGDAVLNPVAFADAKQAMSKPITAQFSGQECEKPQIKIGTPIDLGIPVKKWFGIPHITTLSSPILEQLRNLTGSNSIPVSQEIQLEHLKKGTLRMLPFQKLWDAWLIYDPINLQLAINPKNEIVGFFGSPIPVNRMVSNKILNSKKLALKIEPGLKEALQDSRTRVYLNTMLCVDEKYRGLGLAGRMEKATEEFILEKVTRQDPAARIVLIITHEADNVASARAHDKLGYQSLGIYVNPKYSNIKLSIRAKVLNA